MTWPLRRAGAFALVGALSLAAPLLGPAAAAPFVVVAALAAFVVEDGPAFELFARPGDHEERRLYGLAGFALAAAGLALFAPLFGMPVFVFVASVLVLSGGNLAEAAARQRRHEPVAATVAFIVGGTLAGVFGQLAVGLVAPAPTPALAVFFAASAALLGALVRLALFVRDDPLVLFSMGLLLWLLAALEPTITPISVALALLVTAGFGALAYALDTASITGMVTGVLAGLLMVVLGGFGWFALLITFFGGGGLAGKFRYDRKRKRGLAEGNDGARGSANVLANSAVALGAVLGYAASPMLPLTGSPFVFAFAGSLAAAMADTLSSEIGGLFDTPRLITTLEPVPPGTDGGVTWQGVVAGLLGSLLIAVLGFLFLPISPAGAIAVALAGIAGMVVDSLLGARFENRAVGELFAGVLGGLAFADRRIGNQTVNFLATLAAALVCAALAAATGLAAL
ncbi:DUF92 domain-containing protein [Halococcus thailandensis]|uniref:DUF92 domain-containing protein n=1 Tax=Halococcus thailandensis JCM 13552 TaxID=1227457 RepID=M0MXJ8_9EURY|nr:DUF92 domain-containing protein [Halococcus thailandensis]EMA50457.1 hypothetical protein C451_16550 [Halococcus thailandensis JCM 13552]